MRQVMLAGFWAGVLAFFFTVSYAVIQLMQVELLIPYPNDEILIYASSLCIVIPFVIEMLALHYITPPDKRFWTHAALIFTILYAVFVTANYVVQLATVIPMKLNGQGQEVKILEQTPHSLFWDFDALGYIFMGISMFFAALVLNKSRIQKIARIALLSNAAMTPLISIVYFYPVYSEKLLFLGFPWAFTAPFAMITVALIFKKNLHAANLS